MIQIHKSQEPNSFTSHRCSVNASFSNIPFDVKNKLKDALLKEQGYLCAYCMQRIDSSKMKIEHFLSQSNNKSKELDYSNFFACCLGNEGKNFSAQHCDTHKRDSSISINPADNNIDIQSTIYYTNNGEIKSHNKQYDFDVNNTLNLNVAYLKNNRKSIIKSLELYLSSFAGMAKKSELKKSLARWQEKDPAGCYKQYAGVAIYYFSKKLQRCG